MGMNKPSGRPWAGAAIRRRALLALLILGPTAIATHTLAGLLPNRGGSALEMALAVLFALLFAWICLGCWTALLGFCVLLRRCDRFAVIGPGAAPQPLASAPTAVLMPVCNEEVNRFIAGLRATYESLQKTGRLSEFHFFILSDTGDPDAWVREELAWAGLCRLVGGQGRIFYRRRRINLKRKSGNIADFCRRWGHRYQYMIVLDSDSVMAGATLVRLVEAMERRPEIGILQTLPVAVGRETLLARVQQFAGRLYGPLFAAGLHYWQLGDSQFWGHNAIIRLAPFMRHCGLPRLPGRPPLGGDILSHDFVESALMRRAGWEVWLAGNLGGSYEETPPTLLAELKRDRRWCQGNLQHLRLFLTKGLASAHRFLFLNGVMSYASACLWFLFLILSTAVAIREAIVPPNYFPEGLSLFPVWPLYPRWAAALLGSTALVLFLPKLCSFLFVLLRGEAHRFGGVLRLGLSMVGEILFSTLLAPVRMLFHSRFVLLTLLGRPVGWGSQQRDDSGTSWGEALRFHGGGAVLALAWGGLAWIINPAFCGWLSPVLGALVGSLFLSVWSSRAALGRACRRLGLFLIPEEMEPPPELRRRAGTPGGARRLALPGGAGRLRPGGDRSRRPPAAPVPGPSPPATRPPYRRSPLPAAGESAAGRPRPAQPARETVSSLRFGMSGGTAPEDLGAAAGGVQKGQRPGGLTRGKKEFTTESTEGTEKSIRKNVFLGFSQCPLVSAANGW